MRIDRVNPYGATSPEAIAQFEARRGVLLPAEYKAFLLESNGGIPIPNVFEVPGWHGRGSGLNYFYGIHEGEKVDRLDWACDVHDERVPADLIPIAYDANGKPRRTSAVFAKPSCSLGLPSTQFSIPPMTN
jgi:hypothetical protein